MYVSPSRGDESPQRAHGYTSQLMTDLLGRESQHQMSSASPCHCQQRYRHHCWRCRAADPDRHFCCRPYAACCASSMGQKIESLEVSHRGQRRLAAYVMLQQLGVMTTPGPDHSARVSQLTVKGVVTSMPPQPDSNGLHHSIRLCASGSHCGYLLPRRRFANDNCPRTCNTTGVLVSK
jgi:hypothetical protein